MVICRADDGEDGPIAPIQVHLFADLGYFFFPFFLPLPKTGNRAPYCYNLFSRVAIHRQPAQLILCTLS